MKDDFFWEKSKNDFFWEWLKNRETSRKAPVIEDQPRLELSLYRPIATDKKTDKAPERGVAVIDP